MPGLDRGTLNKRISIEAEIRTPNGSGGFTTEWAQIENGRIWAGMIALRGDEALALGIQRSTQLWQVTIGYRAGFEAVATKHRLRRGTTTLNIRTAVDPYGDRDRIVMTAESGVAS